MAELEVPRDQLKVIKNIQLARMITEDCQIILKGAIVLKGPKIHWVGREKDLPFEFTTRSNHIDGKNHWVTPGLIDCHTHLIFGGNRSHEFKARLTGSSYREIARLGGGITATVKATRLASEETLYHSAKKRVHSLCREGVTTIEIKSGYGLDFETEVKMLRVAQQISKSVPVRIQRTYLGAHTLPDEYKSSAEEYLSLVCDKVIPYLKKHNLADAVDIFCDKIAFNREQTKRVLRSAIDRGFPVKMHCDQLSNLGGAILAAKLKALSIDHLEHLAESGVKAIAQSGTVAVLLPGAFYFLKESKLPPITLLREHQVPIALGSDLNPGSSPIVSLRIMMQMGCVYFGLTPSEALAAVTCNAAKALGLENEIGSIETGKEADLVFWDIEHPDDLAYCFDQSACREVMKSGRFISTPES